MKIMQILKNLRKKYWIWKANRLYKSKSLDGIPINLGVAMTDKCNVRCRYCMREQFTPPEGTITLDQMKYLIREMPYCIGVCIMGLCEPLINKEVPDIIRWLKDEKNLNMSLTTNGMIRLTDDVMDSLTRIDDFVFSIDTFDNETHKFLRPGTNLSFIITQLINLLQYKHDHGLGKFDNPPIHINSVITRQNWHQIPGLIKMLEPYADELTYLMIDPVTRPDYQDFEEPLMLARGDFERDIDQFKKIARESPLNVIGFDWMFLPSYEWADCALSWNSMFIEPNGDAYFCYNYDYVLGNVFKEDPLKVWNSEKARRFRQQLLTDDPPLIQCHSCNFARPKWQPKGEYWQQGYDKRDVL